MASITRPVGGTPPNPNRAEVAVVQALLNRNRPVPFRQIAEDGVFTAETAEAIAEFQRRVVKMAKPDGRVDPNGATLRALNAGAAPKSAATVSLPGVAVTVTISHGNKQPKGVTGLAGAESTSTNDRYESTMKVSGGVTIAKSLRCSIYPDNMNVKGRIKDGTYPIALGFHKRDGNPKTGELKVATNGKRPCLVVNGDASVPVISNLATKTTASAVHVHNGFRTWKAAHAMSEGCQILHPDDWDDFLNAFFAAYPVLADWGPGTGTGKKVGNLVVGV